MRAVVPCVVLTLVASVVTSVQPHEPDGEHQEEEDPEDQQITLSHTDPFGNRLSPAIISRFLVSPYNATAGSSSRGRQRRATTGGSKKYNNQDVSDFSEEEKWIIVQAHNDYREQQGAKDMMYMYWDDKLADIARTWVGRCSWEHSPKTMRKNIEPYTYVGENLYASTGTYNPAEAIQNWYDEIKFYDLNSNTCRPSEVCGHYTQVVWASSYAVGCAVKYCNPLRKVSFGRGFYVSCNYGPGGNFIGRKPFEKGKACSSCSEDTPYCVQNMCAKYPVVGSGALSRGLPSLIVIGWSIMTSLAVILWPHTSAVWP